MDLQCQLNDAEVREALRMNLTSSFWWRAAYANLRILVLIGVFGTALVTGVSNHHGISATQIGLMLLIVTLLILGYGVRVWRTVGKRAKQMNESCNRLILDVTGVTAFSATGISNFSPWTVFHRWREGKLVFTIGDAKGFRTVPKSALNEMQVHEVRGLLGSQVR